MAPGNLYEKDTMILKHNFLFLCAVENLIRSKNHKYCCLFIYLFKQIFVLQNFLVGNTFRFLKCFKKLYLFF